MNCNKTFEAVGTRSTVLPVTKNLVGQNVTGLSSHEKRKEKWSLQFVAACEEKKEYSMPHYLVSTYSIFTNSSY